MQSPAQHISFNHYSIENGLSQNSVLAIAQDTRGFLWFGTARGLNRYDGNHFRIYTTDSVARSLRNSYILSLFCSSDKVLWIGTASGLCTYNPDTDDFDNIQLEGIRQPAVNCIYEDQLHNIWIGTVNGLKKIPVSGSAPSTRKVLTVPQGAGYNIRCLYQDRNGSLWIGTTSGLIRMEPGSGLVTSYRSIPGNPGSLPNDYVTSVAEDSRGNLWVGTLKGGICTFDPAGNSFLPYPHINGKYVRKILTDYLGRLWIGTQDGITIIDPATMTAESCQHTADDLRSLSQNSVHSIFEDSGKSIWVGTYFGGINVSYPYQLPFVVRRNGGLPGSISNNVVSTVERDGQGNLWVSTEGGGLNMLSSAGNKSIVYKNDPADPHSLGSNLIKTLFRDTDGNIWLGTHGGGLNLLPAGQHQFRRLLTGVDEIAAVLEDSQQRFWVGTNNGMLVFRREGATLRPLIDSPDCLILKGMAIKKIYEDAHKNIWVACNGGVFQLRHQQHEFDTVHQLNNLSANCVQEDASGHIWVGLYYEGLRMLDPQSGRIIKYRVENGLPHNNIVSLINDNRGNLWIGTSNGLSVFNFSDSLFKNYTTSDGIAGNELNYNAAYKDPRGEMFFGGFNGLTSFFPEKITTNKFVAPLIFTSLYLFNDPVLVKQKNGLLKKDISMTSSIRFRHDQNVFTLHFSLLSYIKSDKNHYAYQLKGVDKGWNLTATPSITYTNLPPGTYTLLVKGANNDGIWSEPASMQIIISPPFWHTGWAYLCYALISGGIIFFITRFLFLRAIMKKEQILHQLKLNFFTNISHEIKTHLSLIIGPLEKMLLSGKTAKTDNAALMQMKKNADNLLLLVSEQMDFRKAETGHLKLHFRQEPIIPFLQHIYESFSDTAKAGNIELSFTAGDDIPEVYFDRHQLEKVFVNLLSNACKFTPAGGRVSMSVTQRDNTVEVSITDNGNGISPENLQRIFDNFYQENDYGRQNTGYGIGLALARSIVELHRGKITATSIPGDKTVFTVVLQKGEAHLPEKKSDTITAQVPYLPTAGSGQVIVQDPGSDIPVTNTRNTILLIEDNEEMRAFIRDAFFSQYHILESDNGNTGWQRATEDLPDLIISDVMMPEMDGLSLCYKLKTDERTSHIPIILLTARSAPEHYVSGLEMGADIYLTKPFSIRLLELHIRNLLASRERIRQKFGRHKGISEKMLKPSVNVVNTVDQQFLSKAIKIVNDHMHDPEFGVLMFCTKIAMSRPVLYKKLKAVTDMSVNDFIKSMRLQKARELLNEGKAQMDDVAYMVGYMDRKYFIKEYNKFFNDQAEDD